MIFQPSVLLRRVLMLDALSCASMGAVLATFAVPLAPLLELPEALLRGAGWLLLPIAAVFVLLGTRKSLARAMVWAVIVLNGLWALLSCVLLLTDWVAPNAIGYCFVLGQAAITALLAEFEYRALLSNTAPMRGVPA